MIRRIKRFIYRKTNSDYKLYLHTLQKTLDTLNDVKLEANSMEYVSQSKLERLFCDAGISKSIKSKSKEQIEKDVTRSVRLSSKIFNGESGRKQGTIIGLEKEFDVRSNIEDIRIYLQSKNNRLNTFENVKKGGYFFVHFPVMGGRFELATKKKYPNTYFWCGRYRNLELFICGNIKNVYRENCNNTDEYLWNPSDNGASVKIFDEIESKILNGEKFNISVSELFNVLESNIKKETARLGNINYGWKDMIIKCDEKEVLEGGKIRIFGSPVIVSSNTSAGYGWYNVAKKDLYDKDKFYEFEYGEFTGRVLCKIERKISKVKDILYEPILCDNNEIYRQIKIDGRTIEIFNCDIFYSVKKNKIDDFFKNKWINYIDSCNDIVGIVLTDKFIRKQMKNNKLELI